jgi:hypothetical protein
MRQVAINKYRRQIIRQTQLEHMYETDLSRYKPEECVEDDDILQEEIIAVETVIPNAPVIKEILKNTNKIKNKEAEMIKNPVKRIKYNN